MIQHVKTSEIKTAKYNPKARTEHIAPLMKSIKEHGILVPLIIDAESNLIDGHRRLESAKKLKIDKVPTISIKKDISKDKAYEIINTTSKKIANHDMIFIHLNGGSVSPRVLKQINLLEEAVGPDGLKRLGDRGATYTILNYAYKVKKYCSAKEDTFLKKCIFWLIDNKMIYPVRRAMEAGVKKDVILKAVAVNRPLKIKYE